MNFQDNFKRIGNIDVSDFQHKLLQLDENNWLNYNWRQRRYKAHRNTHTIPLLYDNDFRYLQPTKHPNYSIFENELTPLIDTASSIYSDQGYLLRLLLTRLSPKTEIEPHKDNGLTLQWVHRIHIPIQTNSLVAFTVGNETLTLKEGEIWEINNCRVHSVRNASPLFRIHLILDWVTPDLAQAYLQKQFGRNLSKKIVTSGRLI